MLQGRAMKIKRLEAVFCASIALYVLHTLTSKVSLPLSQSRRSSETSDSEAYTNSESKNDKIEMLGRELTEAWKVQKEVNNGTKQRDKIISDVKVLGKTPTFLSNIPTQQNLPSNLKKPPSHNSDSYHHVRPSGLPYNLSNTNATNLCSIRFDLGLCSCKRKVTFPFPSACPEDATSAEDILKKMKEVFGHSTCGDWATIRGPKQKVVSYSVHGGFPNDYYQGLDFLVPKVAEVYPGWAVRVYHHLDESNATVRSWMCSLACKYSHIDFCNVDQIPALSAIRSGTSCQAWRFSVVGDPLVDRYMVRDVDSPILQREVDAVHQWLKSSSCFHIMRDNIFHRAPIMAGMWGGCNSWEEQQLRIIRSQMFQDVTAGIDDQSTLKSRLWPLAQENATIHDSYTCGRFPGSQPFPSQRVNFNFVGQRAYRKQYQKERTFMQCPWRCRPRKHPDWIYC